MTDLKKIIASMSDDVRIKAEAFARAKGITLEEAVSEQLQQEISNEDLDAVSGGRALFDKPVELKVETDVEIDVQ